MKPVLAEGEYVFCTVEGELEDYAALKPLATFNEQEGLTLVLSKESAVAAGTEFQSTYRKITLTVHSSLDAVGLTAAISQQLTSAGISANIIAAYYHDHVFVPSEKADDALSALSALSQQHRA